VALLGELPLALEQAASYIRETSLSINDYRRLYETKPAAGLQRAPSMVDYYSGTVATTCLLSFEQVEKRSKIAADLMRLMAFMDGKRIPRELFVDCRELQDILVESHAMDNWECCGCNWCASLFFLGIPRNRFSKRSEHAFTGPTSHSR